MPDKPGYIFEMPLKVRDYEVDSQGIVNNAVYLHYLEHTRHEFCQSAGVSFRDLQASGVDPVVRRVEIDYLVPLGLGQRAVSRLWLERKGPRFFFHQDLYAPTGSLSAHAVVTIVALRQGHIDRGDELARLLEPYITH